MNELVESIPIAAVAVSRLLVSITGLSRRPGFPRRAKTPSAFTDSCCGNIDRRMWGSTVFVWRHPDGGVRSVARAQGPASAGGRRDLLLRGGLAVWR